MNSPLRFITVRRAYGHNLDTQDTASLSIGGRTGKPGFFSVLGGLNHATAFAPATEQDRKALIAFLESEECKALVANT